MLIDVYTTARGGRLFAGVHREECVRGFAPCKYSQIVIEQLMSAV